MAVWTGMGQTIQQVFDQLLARLTLALPGIVAALLLLSFGYFLGLLLGTAVKKLLEMTKVCEVVIAKAKITHFMGETDLTSFFGTIVKWYIFILFLSPAADLVKLRTLSFFLDNVALWVPNLIVAIILALFGMLIAEYTTVHIRALRAKGTMQLARIAKVIILLFTAILSLQQIGVNVSFASNVVLIVLGGIMLAFAIAVGLGFGFAFRDEARGILQKVKRKL